MEHNNLPLFLANTLLMLDACFNFLVTFLNVCTSFTNLLFNVINHFSLLFREYSEITKQLVQFLNTSF